MSNYPAGLPLAMPAYGPASLLGDMTVAPVADSSSGVRTAFTLTGAADTARTASTEQADFLYNGARTVTWATGALTTQRFARFVAPTIAFVGASTVTTAATVDISGAPVAGTNATITNSYALRVATGASFFGGAVALTPAAAAAGARVALTVTGATDTGVTASTEQSDVYLNLGHTVTWATGALATQRFVRISAPTVAFAGASTLTDAVTVDIAGAPVAGTNATITNAYALRVVAGATLLGGAVGVGAAAPASAALAVTSTTQGLLLPRMTETQRDAISAPAEGLVVYNTTSHKINVRVAAAWEVVTSA